MNSRLVSLSHRKDSAADDPSLTHVRSSQGRGLPDPILFTLTPAHLLLGCNRLCRYMKFTNNLLMSLHLEREEPRVHVEWSTVSVVPPPPPRLFPPLRPHLPLFAGGQLPGLRLLQLMVHFGCLVIQPLEVPIGSLKGHL